MQFEERLQPEPITCSEDKGIGESSDSIDWVEQAMQADPKFAERMKVRHDVNEIMDQ